MLVMSIGWGDNWVAKICEFRLEGSLIMNECKKWD